MSATGFMHDHLKHPGRRRYQAARVAGRFLLGWHLDGQRRTDARWSRPGSTPLTPTGYASRWAHYPHRKRAGIRLLALIIGMLLGVGLLADAQSTATTLRVVFWSVLFPSLLWMVWEKSRRYGWRRETIAPLGEVLAVHLKDARYTLDPRTWIKVPVDVQDRPSRIYLTPTYDPRTEAQEKALVKLVSRRIGLVSPSYTFELQGPSPYLELVPAPAPPGRVSFADAKIRALVDATPEGQFFLGLANRAAPTYLDLVKGAPHTGWSMPTNGGKSTAVRGPLMQHLHKGGIALVLDPKMDSHLWCRDLPGVRYADTPQEIHEALMWLSGEIDRRNRIGKEHADYYGDVDQELVGPRLLVIAEELNSLEIDLAAYWRTIRDPKRGDPLRPASLTALGRAMNMGRSKRVHVFPVAQELLVQSLGGPAAKANMSTFVLGRAGAPTWNKLAPQCKVGGRYPKKSMDWGRVYVVTGDDAVPVQTMHTDELEAREYAMSGVVAVFPGNEASDEGGTPQTPSDHSETREGASLPHGLSLVPDTEPEGVTLTEAAEVLALTVKTLRNARDRDERFPDPVTRPGPGQPTRYLIEDLQTWADNRPRVIRERDE